MNDLNVNNLIEFLDRPINSNDDIEPQLKKLFTVWRNSVVPRNSWWGRLATITVLPHQQSAADRKIRACFAEFLETYTEKINFTPKLIEFRKRCNQDNIPIHTISGLFRDKAEINELGRRSKKNENDAVVEEDLDSFLLPEDSPLLQRVLPQEVKVMTPEEIKKLWELNDATALTAEDFDFLGDYLRNNPEAGIEDWEVKLSQMRENVLLEQEQTQKLQESDHSESHDAFIEEEAVNLLDRIHTLKAGSKESVLHVQSYGNRGSFLPKLLSHLKDLPMESLDDLPQAVRDIIKSGQLPEPEVLANLLFDACFKKSSEIFSLQVNEESLNNLGILLPDDTRSAPENFKILFPEIFQHYLDEMLQNGVLGNAAIAAGYPCIQKIIQTLAKQDFKLLTNPSGAEMRRIVVPIVVEYLTNLENSGSSIVENYLEKVFQGIGRSLPTMVFELTGTEDLFLQGEVWFDFVKQRNGQFEINLYTSGQSLRFHPTVDRQGNKSFCLKIKDIDPKTIDLPFLEVLLRHKWEPSWNSEASSNAYQIYHDFLVSLRGHSSNDQASVIKLNPNKPFNQFEIVAHLLFKKTPNRDLIFNLKFENLLNYFRSHCFIDGSVHITDEDATLLKPLIAKLKVDFERICKSTEGTESNKVEMAEIHTSLKHLSQLFENRSVSSSTALPSFNLSSFGNEIQKKLINLGLTPQRLLELESTLEWFFGEEIRPILHPWISNATNLLSSIKVEQSDSSNLPIEHKVEHSNNGSFPKTYATLYLSLAWKVARLAMLASGFTAGGAWTLLGIPTLLSLLPYILPKRYYDYYCETMNKIRFAIAKSIFEICWNKVLPEQTKKTLLQLRTLPLTKISETFNEANLIPEISFNTEVQEVLEESEIELVPQTEKTIPLEEAKAMFMDLGCAGANPEAIQNMLQHQNLPELKQLYRIVEALPIPSLERDEQIFFDSNICIHFTALLLEIADEERKRKQFDDTQIILASYHILALMHCKAIQDGVAPQGHPFSENPRINTLPLLDWYFKARDHLNNKDRTRAEILIGYFTPELKYHIFHSDEAIIRSIYHQNQYLWTENCFEDQSLAREFTGLANHLKRVGETTSSMFDFSEAIKPYYENLSEQSIDLDPNSPKNPIHIDLRRLKFQTLLCRRVILVDTNREQYFSRKHAFRYYRVLSTLSTGLIYDILDIFSISDQFNNQIGFLTKYLKRISIQTFNYNNIKLETIQKHPSPAEIEHRALDSDCSLRPNNIKEWLTTAMNLHWKQIADSVNNLPLAIDNPNCPWNEIGVSTELIGNLFEITKLLIRNPENETINSFAISIPLYRLLAIMWKLSLRLENSNINHPVHPVANGIIPDFYPFLIAIHRTPRYELYLNQWDEIEKILQVFEPNTTLWPPLSNEQLEEKRKRSLWSTANRAPLFSSPTLFCPYESAYLKAFDRVSKSKMHERYKQTVLHSSSLPNEERIIPISYTYLKLQTLICTSLSIYDYYSVLCETDLNSSDSITEKLIKYRLPTVIYLRPKQHELLNSNEEGRTGQMALTVPSQTITESILHLLDPEKPIYENQISNFKTLINKPGALKYALKLNPKIVEILRDRLSKFLIAIHNSDNERKMKLLAQTILLSQKIEEDCVKYLGIQRPVFAFIDEWIEIITLNPSSIFDQNTFDHLIKIKLNRVPSDPETVLDPDIRLKSASIVLESLLFQRKGGSNKNFFSSFQKWKKWYFVINECLRDPKTRTKLLRIFYTELKLPKHLFDHFIDKYHFTIDRIGNEIELSIIDRKTEEKLNEAKSLTYYLEYNTAWNKQLFQLLGRKKFDQLEIIDFEKMQTFDKLQTFEQIIKPDQPSLTLRHTRTLPNGDIESFDLYHFGLNFQISEEITQHLDANKNPKPSIHIWRQTNCPPNETKWIFFTASGREYAIIGTEEEVIKRIKNKDKVKNKNKDKQTPKKIDLHFEKIKDSLKPISGFCSIEEIEIEEKQDQNQLPIIHLKPQKLSFQLSQSPSEPVRAFSNEFPGYFISPRQYHGTIAGMAHTLLIENRDGVRKVLVPVADNFIALTGLWTRLDAISGPLVKSYLSQITSKLNSNTDNSYYVYDIKTNEDGSASLVSTAPEGLAFLLIYHLHRLEFKQADAVCREILSHYNGREAVPDSWWPELNYLLIPAIAPSFAKYRWKIIAAKEMNKRLEPIEEPINQSSYLPTAMNLMLVADLFSFLNNPTLGEHLDSIEEYFLYRHLLRQVVEAIKKNLPDNEKLNNLISLDFVEALLCHPPFNESPLIERYLELKQSLNGDFSIAPHSAELVARVIRFINAPCPLPEFQRNSSEYQPVPLINDNYILKAFGSLRKIKSFSKTQNLGFDCVQLAKEIEEWDFGSIQFNEKTFKPSSIKKKFFSYYCLMRGDCEIRDEKMLCRQKEALIRSLTRNKSFGDTTTQKLVTILLQVGKHPESYPLTRQLIDLHPHNEQENEAWTNLLNSIWNTVILQDLSDTIIGPILSGWLTYLPGRTFLSGALSEIWRTDENWSANGTNIGLTKMRDGLLSKFSTAAQKYGDQISLWLTGVATQGTHKQKAIAAGVTTLATAATCYATYRLGSDLYEGANNLYQYTGLNESEYLGTIGAWTASLAPVLIFGANAGLAYFGKGRVGPRDLFPAWNVNAMVIATKAVNSFVGYERDQILKRAEKSKQAAEAKLSRQELSLEDLKEDETIIDRSLDEIFELVFEEIPVNNDEQIERIEPVDASDAKTPFEIERYERINKSIEAFYAKGNKNKPLYRLINLENLGLLTKKLQDFEDVLRCSIEKDKRHLEQLLKRDFETICNLIVKPDALPFDPSTGYTAADLPLIRLIIAGIHLRESRYNQVQALFKLSEKLLMKKPKKSELTDQEYFVDMDRLATGLKTRTTYDLESTDPRLAQAIARFEAATGMKLWDRQSNTLNIVAKSGNIVFVLPPGQGKTAAIIPLIIAEEGDGEQLVMGVFPKQLAGDNFRTINMQSHQILNRVTYAMRFNRTMELSTSTFETLFIIFNSAVRNGQAILLTKEDAQALDSIFTERCDEYEQRPSYELQRNLILLHRILKLIDAKGIINADESHETLAHRKKLNFPIGRAKPPKTRRCLVMEIVMREIMACEPIKLALQDNKTCYFSDYQTVYKRQIAEKVCQWKEIEIPYSSEDEYEERMEELIRFVCDKAVSVPTWLEAEPLLFERISLIKGILNDVIPRCFKSRAGVEFGNDEGSKTDFARPSEGNNGASTTDTVENPYEAYIKTLIMLFNSGITFSQFEKLIEKLTIDAKKQMNQYKIPYEKTNLYRRYGSILTKEMILGKNDKAFMHAYRKLSQNPDICMLYARHIIRPQILSWKRKIENNSHDFASMPNSMISCTGTPYNDGTYPAWLQTLQDDGTIGEMLDIIHRKCPKDGIHLLKENQPKQILDEMLISYFMPGSSFSALIDGGAMFTCLSNVYVAKKMFEHCKEHRPDIKAVKFYMKDANGVETLHCFKEGSETPVPADQVNIPPKNCLTYYDQRHGFGADVKQEGDGIETVGPNHPLYKWLQELFRVRGLKNESRLETFNGILLPQQKIHLAMTIDVQKLVLGRNAPVDRIPTLEEIIKYAIRNEATIAEEENYSSMISKIRHVPKKAIRRKILRMPSEQFVRWHSLFCEYKHLFITEVNYHPVKLFGHVKKRVPTEEALGMASQKAKSLLHSSPHLSEEEIAAIGEEIDTLPRPQLAEHVLIAIGPNGEMADEALHGLGLEQTVELNMDQRNQVEQNEEVDQNQELELNQQQEQTFQRRRRGKHRYTEMPWPAIENPASLDVLKFDRNEQTLSSWWSKKVETCPLFTVKHLFASASNESLRPLERSFDARLWFSNNFLSHRVSRAGETPQDIGSYFQCHLAETLIHYRVMDGQVEILHVGTLSLKDSAFWKSVLKNDREYWEAQEIKVVLWHAKFGLAQGGDMASEELLSNSRDLKKLIVQLKILDGQTTFNKEDEEYILEWLEEQDVETLTDALRSFMVSREKQFEGSHLDKLCLEATPGFYLDSAL